MNESNLAKDSLATELEASKKEIGRLQAILSNTQNRELESKKTMQTKIDTLYSVIDRLGDGPANKRPKIDQRK